MNEDHREIQDRARRLGLRVVPVLSGEDDIPKLDRRPRVHAEDRSPRVEGNKTPSFLDSPPAPAWFMQQEQNERVVMAINRVSTAIWFLCLSVVGVGFLLWSSIVIVGDSIIKVNPFQ